VDGEGTAGDPDGGSGEETSLERAIHTELDDIHRRFADLDEGQVADYIPELADANPLHFGIAGVGVRGRVIEVGDTDVAFTIQSISKPFVYGLALEDHGRDGVLARVGVEPSGEAFNAIELDEVSNRPYNPMINSGAIATTALVEGGDQVERLHRVLAMLSAYAGRDLQVDSATFFSERATGDRNRAIAHLMRSSGMLPVADIDEVLELYFQQCSVLITCRDLAVMAATLANGGVNPVTGERAIAQRYVKDVLSVMLSCGMYDYSGEWAYRVGVPAKSGVGGGITAVLPGQAGLAVFSPPLDAKGNSLRGIRVFEELSSRFSLHFMEVLFHNNTIGHAFDRATDAS
jgi:glutaminase